MPSTTGTCATLLRRPLSPHCAPGACAHRESRRAARRLSPSPLPESSMPVEQSARDAEAGRHQRRSRRPECTLRRAPRPVEHRSPGRAAKSCPRAARNYRSPSRGRRRARACRCAAASASEVRRQIVAAALLAALDQDHAAPVRALLSAARAQRRKGAEDRVAVVGGAATIELSILHHRRPGPSPVRQPVISGCLSRCP